MNRQPKHGNPSQLSSRAERLQALWLIAVVVASSTTFAGENDKELEPPGKAAREASDTRSSMKDALARGRRKAWESNLRARDARQTVDTAREQLQKARKALAAKSAKKPPEKLLQAARRQVELVQLVHDRAVARRVTADAQLKVADREFDKHQAAYNKAVVDHTDQLRAAQQAAQLDGHFVSFANDIAPILVRRCLACHSARIAKGRVDLENHRGVLSTGKNGITVVPGDAGKSLLFHAIVDGSMPEGNPPLTKPQVTLIRRWITLLSNLSRGRFIRSNHIGLLAITLPLFDITSKVMPFNNLSFL